MRHDQIWEHIHAERAALAGHLATLTPAQWTHETLCPGWTVLDTAAHVIANPQLGLRHILAMTGRNLGRGYNAMIDREVRRWGRDQTPERVLADFATYAASTRHVVVTTSVEPLVDVLVHTQDVLRPLGIRHDMSPEAAAVAADRARLLGTAMGWRAARGLRLVATDTDWARGRGPVVEGPMAELLMLCTGREADRSLLTHGSSDVVDGKAEEGRRPPRSARVDRHGINRRAQPAAADGGRAMRGRRTWR